MARQTLPVTKITRAGIADAAGIPAHIDGHAFDNNGTTFLEVTTTAGVPVTLTVETPGTVADRQIEDLTISVPGAATNRKIGPFQTDLYSRPAEGTDPNKAYLNFVSGEVARVTNVKAYTI